MGETAETPLSDTRARTTVEGKLKIGIPKGSLQEATFALFKKAGYEFRTSSGRSYHPTVDDPQLEPLLLRPQEIPRYIERGILDAGITGEDWIADTNSQHWMEDRHFEDRDAYDTFEAWMKAKKSNIESVATFLYSKATRNPIKIVLAVQNGSTIYSVDDLQDKRVATEYMNLTRLYLKWHRVRAKDVEFSWGVCEVKVPELVDAIVVNTETGSSLRAHNLKTIGRAGAADDRLMTSQTCLAANRWTMEDHKKREKLENISMLLHGALEAENLVGLKMNVKRTDLAAVTELLKSLGSPTISPLADDAWVAAEVIMQQSEIREIIPQLIRTGARGIVEYPLNKVVSGV